MALPPAERRLVSVLFVDLEDFTRLVEELDPEDARSFQSRFFALARSIIDGYGGTVEKYVGDAVMAVWGAPRGREDDAERAVRAALDTVEAVPRLEVPARPGGLRARAAVASGEAAVGPAVEGQGMLAGDPVNTAARLQGAAPSGGVLVDQATRLLAGRSVRFAPAGPVALKGKARPIETWLASRVAPAAGVARRAGHGGPFVGRSAELTKLLRAYDDCAASGQARLLSVLGISGIGKSRLALELEAELRARPSPPAVLVGRASAYGEGRPFAPLGDIVRRWAGIGPRTSVAAAGRRLARAVGEGKHEAVQASLAGHAEQAWHRFAALLDPAAGAGFEREALFASWRVLIERICAEQPTVLLFEDLQWADDGMLDFIEYLARWPLGLPVLIVTLARPEMLERRPDWAAEVANAEQVELDPLPAAAMTELLVALAPELTSVTMRRIVERAGGIPLYAVEFAKLRRDDPSADPAQLPDTLRALVAARIDALPDDDRWLLLRASVLGRRFDTHALAVLAGVPDGEVLTRLDGLLRRQLLAVDDSADGGGQVSFVQDVVRDVGYRTLTRADRRALHLAAADHLAEEHEDLVEELAEHLYSSLRVAAADLAAAVVTERAVATLVSAAERAIAVHVPDRAVVHLERALELVTDGDRRLELLPAAAAAARAAARFERAEVLLRELIEGYAERQQTAAAARTRAQLASLMLATERHATALGELEQALAGMHDLDADPAGVELAGQLARAKVLVGDDAEALDWADRTMRAARRLGLSAVHVDALTTRGTARIRLGRDSAGLADLRRAVETAERHGLGRGELRARNNLAWLVVLDDPRATLDTARGGMELARRLGVADMALQLALVLCTASIDTGDWDEALTVIEEAREQPQATAHRVQFAAIEATIRGLRGDRRAGRQLEALRPPARGTDPQMVGAIDLAQAWIHFAAGRFAPARAAARRAARVLLGADRHVSAILALRADLWLGNGAAIRDGLATLPSRAAHGRMAAAAEQTMRAGASALLGSPDAAILYEQVAEQWRALDLPLHLALCLAERDLLLGGGRDEARAVFAALGAEALLRLMASASVAR